MKTTSEPCFKSPIELACWQEKNCQLCKKSVWYNERLHKMPKYKCAVQSQVEQQQEGKLSEINERTYLAVKNPVCPFISCNVLKQEEDIILEFSKGESLVKNSACVENSERIDVKPVEIPPTYRHVCISELFGNIENTIQSTPEEEFQQKVKTSTELMLKNLTVEEQMKVAFVPIVINQIIFSFAEMVTNYAATHRLEKFKKTSREIKRIKQDYYSEISKDLDNRHTQKVFDDTGMFLAECESDFNIMFFSINGELKRNYPNIEHDELYTYIFITLLMSKFLDDYIRRTNEIVKEKCKDIGDAVPNQYIFYLARELAKQVKGMTIRYSGNIETCFKIFDNAIKRTKFELIDNK